MSEKINVNGKRLNKLEETVKLLQKLNEELYPDYETGGYSLVVTLCADGSGWLHDSPFAIMYKFEDLKQLEDFLSCSQLRRLALVRNEKVEK